MKVVNIKGLIIIIAFLLVIQFGVGMLLSPMLGKVAVEAVNKSTPAKINIGKINFWPLTLGFSARDIKVFDPDDTKKKMIQVKKASIKISPFALLARRLVVSGIQLSGVELDLKGEPDGSFNIQKIAGSPESAGEEKKGSMFDRFKGKRDWFTRVYDMVKGRSKEASGKEALARKKEERKVKTEVIELPKGRRVLFRTARDEYAAEIRKLDINDATINVDAGNGRGVTVEKADIRITGIAIDPKKGAEFDSLTLRGALSREGRPAGSFSVEYDTKEIKNGLRSVIDVNARKIDLPVLRFVYQDSLPVDIEQGILDMASNTTITNEELDSRNKITLNEQKFAPSGGGNVGMIPMPALCDALNQVHPLKLNFDIGGTVDDPRFSGFEEIIQEVAKPYLENVVENQAKGLMDRFLKTDASSDGASAGTREESTEKAAEDTVQTIKNLFGGSK